MNEFEINKRNDGVYIRILAECQSAEIAELLRKDGLTHLDRDALEWAISNHAQWIKVSPPVSDASFSINISPDRMRVYLSITPAYAGRPITAKDVLNQLHSMGIVHGVNRQVIDSAVAKQSVKDFLIAQGDEPKPGRDGWVEIFADTTSRSRPKLKEDGSVDFRTIDLFPSVVKDEIIGRVHYPQSGVDGRDVFGNLIKHTEPKSAPVEAVLGENIKVSDDGKIIAAISGHLVSEWGCWSVRDVLKIDGDVDFSVVDILPRLKS